MSADERTVALYEQLLSAIGERVDDIGDRPLAPGPSRRRLRLRGAHRQDGARARRGLTSSDGAGPGTRSIHSDSVTGLKVTDIPLLAEQWDDVRNVDLDPTAILATSRKRVSWQCRTHLSHHWMAQIYQRATKRTLCPFEYGRMVGEDNSLRAKFPEIANDWHPTKNGKWTPDNTAPQSARKVWWACGDHGDYERKVEHRTIRGWGCPHADHKAKRGTQTDSARVSAAKRARRIRRIRRAGEELLAGNTEASGTWRRVLSERELTAARDRLAMLEARLGGPRAVGVLLGRSHASVENYRARVNVPVAVAARLEHLAAIAEMFGRRSDLTAWFATPNPSLNGARPRESFLGEWAPTDAGPSAALRAAKAAKKDRPAA